jgi:AcrR family transcriptional regulator
MPARQRRAKIRLEAHDVDAMVQLDRVSAPKQARSLDSLRRIVRAMETLLERKAFPEISMSEIEAESKCGLATIYARFRDKASILAALHESLRDRFSAQIDQWLNAEHWTNASFEEATMAIATGIVEFYSRNHNLLRAALLLDDAEVYERAAASFRKASLRMQHFLAAKSNSKLNAQTLAERADLATRAIYALLHQRLIFQSILSGSRPRDDREFAAEIALLLRLCVR